MEGGSVQNLFVMRHGERIDNCDPQWIRTAPRPWDPNLTEKGKMQAFAAGKKLRTQGWNITRVFCSPFLRCIQTTAEVVSALCAVEEDISSLPDSSSGVAIDPSRVKVSIENGLCEVLNYLAIRCPPSNIADWNLDRSELESILPAGTIDHTVEPIWAELPKWQETTESAHNRYLTTIQALADKFPQENVLCITHGEGVGVSISGVREDVSVYAVDYCAYSHAQRAIITTEDGLNAGRFNVLTESGSNSGIFFNKKYGSKSTQ